MNNINSVPYLRTTRNFPEETKQLTIEVNRAYVDTANAVNLRTIGIFTLNLPSLTGESWYLQGTQKQQSFRQVYTFASFSSPLRIPHGINIDGISGFTRIYGTATDGTNWYPLPYVDVLTANNQINVKIGPKNIIITAGAGAPPAITNGTIVLEWLAQQ